MTKISIAWLRQSAAGLVVLLALTAVLGVAYPAAVWLFGRIDSGSAEGSPLKDRNGCVVGSAIIGVDPQASGADPYFHISIPGARPSLPGSALPRGGFPLTRSLAPVPDWIPISLRNMRRCRYRVSRRRPA
ncbi:potassium-transporting ATPase subunit C [Mycobacteroides abscessus subsp. abscessus]|nr:potassium-transporting ATPase subunit C [Mycobacteroides abscessus subsp. abscessus]